MTASQIFLINENAIPNTIYSYSEQDGKNQFVWHKNIFSVDLYIKKISCAASSNNLSKSYKPIGSNNNIRSAMTSERNCWRINSSKWQG